MLGYGVDGEEQFLARERIECAQQDCDEPSPRGEEHTQVVSLFSSCLLRSGTTLQLAALIAMFLSYIAFGGRGLFVFDLYAGGDNLRVSSVYHSIISFLTFIYMWGALDFALFQVFLADNSKFSRGFRVGSKMLAAAAAIDVMAECLRVTQYLYAFNFMTLKWWAKYQQTGTDWALVQAGTLLHAIALGMYGLALFYIETYHDEGTNEQLGWMCLWLYSAASLGGFINVFFGIASLNSIFLFAALVVATNWAYAFEPLMHKCEPPLHSRDLNADMLLDADNYEMTGGSHPQFSPPYPQYNLHPEENGHPEYAQYDATPYKQF